MFVDYQSNKEMDEARFRSLGGMNSIWTRMNYFLANEFIPFSHEMIYDKKVI